MYTKQILVDIRGEIDSNTVRVEDFNNTLTSRDRTSRQEINKETAAFDGTLNQMDLIDIFTAFHPKQADTFFSSAHGIFSRRNHIIVQKTSLNTFRKTEIISSIFSDYNVIKLVINHMKKVENTRDMDAK